MGLFGHRHKDPNWKRIGPWDYHECECGARRVIRAYANLMGPVKKGWPSTFDKHGRFKGDSGWQVCTTNATSQ